jgi:integrase
VRIKVRDPKTGKVREVKKVLAAAAEAASAKEALRVELETARATTQRVRLADYANSWLSGKLPTLKPSTSAKYASILDNHIKPIFGDHFLDMLEPADIVRWRDAQRAKPATINARLQVMKTMLRDAVAELGLQRDPSARVHAVRQRGSEQGPNRLTADQLAVVLSVFREHEPYWYPLFLFMAFTATRVSEATAVRWEDIDFDAGLIHIRRAHWKGIVGTTKTGSARTLPLPTVLSDALKEHRRRLIAEQAPGIHKGYVFVSRVGTIVRGSSLQQPLDRSLTKAGITDRFTIHGFRRTPETCHSRRLELRQGSSPISVSRGAAWRQTGISETI